MEAMDFLHEWRAMPEISPVLKLVSMILWIAVRDEATSVTFRRKKGEVAKLFYTPKDHGECEMVPPPRHLFLAIMKILRRMAREAVKNPVSAFGFTYTETGHERTLAISIDYSKGEDVKMQLTGLLGRIYMEQEAQNQSDRISRIHRQHVKYLLVAGIVFFVLWPLLWLILFLFF